MDREIIMVYNEDYYPLDTDNKAETDNTKETE